MNYIVLLLVLISNVLNAGNTPILPTLQKTPQLPPNDLIPIDLPLLPVINQLQSQEIIRQQNNIIHWINYAQSMTTQIQEKNFLNFLEKFSVREGKKNYAEWLASRLKGFENHTATSQFFVTEADLPFLQRAPLELIALTYEFLPLTHDLIQEGIKILQKYFPRDAVAALTPTSTKLTCTAIRNILSSIFFSTLCTLFKEEKKRTEAISNFKKIDAIPLINISQRNKEQDPLVPGRGKSILFTMLRDDIADELIRLNEKYKKQQSIRPMSKKRALNQEFSKNKHAKF